MRRVFTGPTASRTAGCLMLICLTCLLSACGGTKERLSDDGLRYTVDAGAVTIIGYEGEETEVAVPGRLDALPVTAVAADAFPGGVLGVSLPESVRTVEEDAFSEEIPPLYILLNGKNTDIAHAPKESLLLQSGQALESGTLTAVFLDELQALYGLTDGGIPELMQFPADMDIYEVPGQLEQDYPYIYISASALDAWPGRTVLSLGERAIVAPERLMELENDGVLFYPADSLTADWVLTVDAAEQVNAQREPLGLEAISPDVALVCAARTRMGELSESYSFDRPDGRPGSSVLDEQGIPFQLYTSITWHCGSVDEGYQGAISNALQYYTRDQNGVLYDKLGLSMGQGSYGGESSYLLSGLYINTTMQELTIGSQTYAIEADHAELSAVSGDIVGATIHESVYGKSVTGIREGALAGGTSLRYVVVPAGISYLDSSAFDGCGSLRAVLVPEGFALGGKLPDKCRMIAQGLDTGDGLATSLYVSNLGGIYLFTDQNRYVLYDIPDDVDSFVVSSQLGDYPVTLISLGAVEGKSNLKKLGFYWDCGIDPAALDALGDCSIYVYNDDNTLLSSGQLGTTLYGSTILSASLAHQINEIRSANGADPVRLTYKAVRSAWIMAQEQAQQYSQDRPDGRAWTTIFDDESIDWGHASMLRDILYTTEDINNVMDEFAQSVAAEQEDFYYHEAGMGLCAGTYGGRQAVFFYGLAYREP